ncbi:MAG: TIGR01777 family oxidoreductase [Bacteroidetes bacterium]|nr:TIGR01777 family oxidoreductase [Bacteroidota bacterium]
MATILLTGGTGMIGTYLQQYLTGKGYDVIVLIRDKTRLQQKPINPKITYAGWNIDDGFIDKNAIAKADYIINLAGAGVADKRWTNKRKKEIVESRTKSCELIAQALKEMTNQVKVVISASAIGWYGNDGDNNKTGFTEDAPAANDFLGVTCNQWENSIKPVEKLYKRLCIFRLGIVFSKSGGALEEFKKPMKRGFAAILGNGKQVISWIHIDDLCRMFLFALEHENMKGVYNAVSPKPVTNKSLTIQLAKQLRNKFFIPVHVPSFILKIMLGEMSIEVLKSATVNCDKIKKAGFTFLYPSVEAALENLNKK